MRCARLRAFLWHTSDLIDDFVFVGNLWQSRYQLMPLILMVRNQQNPKKTPHSRCTLTSSLPLPFHPPNHCSAQFSFSSFAHSSLENPLWFCRLHNFRRWLHHSRACGFFSFFFFGLLTWHRNFLFIFVCVFERDPGVSVSLLANAYNESGHKCLKSSCH